MKAISVGQEFEFTPTGKIFKIAKLTEKRVSWYVGFSFRGGYGINNLKMNCISLKKFNDGVENGTYRLL